MIGIRPRSVTIFTVPDHSNLLAILFALASALTIAWGTVVRHRIALTAPSGKAPILEVIKRPLWWAGLSTALIGYGLQVVALGFGTLLVVQPILVLSMVFTLVLSAAMERRVASARELIWSFILTTAVATLVIVGNPLPGTGGTWLRWLLAVTIGGGILLLIDAIAHRRPPQKALLTGLVTGATFGFVAVFSKATVDVAVAGGLMAMLTSWVFYAVIIGATVGTAIQQTSFNAGDLRNSLPAMTVAEPITAFSLGYLVLGEKLQATDWEWLLMGLALIAMVAAIFGLSRANT